MLRRRKLSNEIENPRPPVTLTPPLTRVRLAPYTADKGVCNHCGATNAATSWYPAGASCFHRYGAGQQATWGTDRLHRSCVRCSFCWDEACVPAEPSPTLTFPIVTDTLILPVTKEQP